MAWDRETRLAALEIGAYVSGYLAAVPFMGGVALSTIAKATGSLLVPMLLAPLLLWAITGLYHRAFEGAKALGVVLDSSWQFLAANQRRKAKG